MIRKEIDSMLANSILQRNRARQMLREHFDELEARNQVTFWTKLYLVHKAQVEWLEKLTSDDE